MPSKKQRRRREKTFRHEYGFVTYDDEGNEVAVDHASELREKKPEKPKQAPARQQRGRAARAAQPPSWNRALRRGGVWGGLMLVVVVFFFKGMPLVARVMWGLLYALAFIPLTYWIDRTAYRSYQKRSGKTAGPR